VLGGNGKSMGMVVLGGFTTVETAKECRPIFRDALHATGAASSPRSEADVKSPRSFADVRSAIGATLKTAVGRSTRNTTGPPTWA
jgi:hypothetical protein